MEKDWLWLCSIRGLYWKHRMTLLRYFGSPAEIRNAGREEFALWEKLGRDWVRRVLPALRQDPEEIQEKITRQGIGFVSREHPDFPQRLLELPDCPHGLFYLGKLPHREPAGAAKGKGVSCVGVVGARVCSPYGRREAEKLAGMLAEAGAVVVSGMACGVDGIAQRSALAAGGESYALLGSGVDVCYPKSNQDLYSALISRGGVLSEFPCGTMPHPGHFPLRNRLISGLSDAVVVVEARERSGSLITADFALEQGRDVYALPGRSGDELSAGCNRLIAQGAGIILSGEDLCTELGLEKTAQKRRKDCTDQGLASTDELVYSNVDSSPCGLEELRQKTLLPIPQLMESLMKLQLSGKVTEIGKNRYIRS